MSSLHQDRLLVEGSEPVVTTGSPLTPARETSRRPTAEKVADQVPSQPQGKAQRSGAAPTVADGSVPTPARKRNTNTRAVAGAGTLADRAKGAVTGRAASAKAAVAKAATTKAATASKPAAAKVPAAPAQASTTKASTAKPAAAKASTAKPAGPKHAATAKSAAVKPATAEAAVARSTRAASAAPKHAAPEHAAPKAGAAATTAAQTTATPTESVDTGARRPTPYKRAAVAETDATQPVAVVEAEAETAAVGEAAEVVASVAEGRSGLLRRRPPSVRHRPAMYLAAAIVSALSISAVSNGHPAAQATDTMSESVSIAQELGIEAQPTDAVVDADAAERLEELAVSRKTRDAEQAAAAKVQADADAAAAAAAAEAARPKAVLPVAGARLTSGFGTRWGAFHAGIDLAAPMRTPEYAAMDGVVLEAGPASGYGLAVYIQHANGDVTVYGHMDSILVQPGQVVRAGDTIALLGNRGQSTGPHLHFEVHVGGMNGQKIDPLPWLRERGIAI